LLLKEEEDSQSVVFNNDKIRNIFSLQQI
jgi:hypothetical protein